MKSINFLNSNKCEAIDIILTPRSSHVNGVSLWLHGGSSKLPGCDNSGDSGEGASWVATLTLGDEASVDSGSYTIVTKINQGTTRSIICN